MAEEQKIRKAPPGFSLLRLILALISSVLIGWFVLSMYLGILWWQEGYTFAEKKAILMVSTEQGNWKKVIMNENNQIQREFMNINNNLLKVTQRSVAAIDSTSTQTKMALKHETLSSATNGMSTAFQRIGQGFHELINLITAATQIVLLKIMLLILAIPLFGLAMAVGIADGLMLRTIRKESLGRESAYLFHQLLSFFPALLKSLFCAFIVWPFLIAPQYALVSLAVVIGLWVSQISSRFKKYV